MRRTVIACVALAGTFAAAALIRREPQPTHAYVQWAGPDSKIDTPGFQLIRDEAAWETLWRAHTGKPRAPGIEDRHATPKIDFTQCLVVACFRGHDTNEDGEILDSILTSDAGTRLRFESASFQTFGEVDGGAVRTTPFGIWVIPITCKPITIEEAHRRLGLKEEELVWKEAKRFDSR